MKEKIEPKKFYFLDVECRPCTSDELDFHLSEFGKAFIKSNALSRWNHVTRERPEKARYELAKLASSLDPKFTQKLHGSEAFPDSFESRFGSKLGVYFDGIDAACKVTAAEAASLAQERDNDAVFSLVPGKLAIFFFHGGSTIILERH